MFCFYFNNILQQNHFGGTANKQAFSTGKHHSHQNNYPEHLAKHITTPWQRPRSTLKTHYKKHSYALATNHIPLALYRELFSRVCKHHLLPFVRFLLYELLDSACSALLRTGESCSSILHYSSSSTDTSRLTQALVFRELPLTLLAEDGGRKSFSLFIKSSLKHFIDFRRSFAAGEMWQ